MKVGVVDMDDMRIEEMTLNAWPAFQTIVRNGWLLRLAAGFTKRSNSVSALYTEPSVDLYEQIQYCERIYAREGLDVVFKVTPFNPLNSIRFWMTKVTPFSTPRASKCWIVWTTCRPRHIGMCPSMNS